MLLSRCTRDPGTATPPQIEVAVWSNAMWYEMVEVKRTDDN